MHKTPPHTKHTTTKSAHYSISYHPHSHSPPHDGSPCSDAWSTPGTSCTCTTSTISSPKGHNNTGRGASSTQAASTNNHSTHRIPKLSHNPPAVARIGSRWARGHHNTAPEDGGGDGGDGTQTYLPSQTSRQPTTHLYTNQQYNKYKHSTEAQKHSASTYPHQIIVKQSAYKPLCATHAKKQEDIVNTHVSTALTLHTNTHNNASVISTSTHSHPHRANKST